jgi:outer membrane immunogenic protein
MFVFAATAAALSFAAPAMAEGKDAAAPAGFRVEALAGWDRASADGNSKSGFVFGVGAGYDFAVSNTISLGVDAEASDSTVKDNGVKAGRDLYAGGRVNFAVGDKTNLYLKAGYTNARVTGGGFGENLGGFRAGVGGQYVFSGKAYVGAEYRYSNYQSDFDRHQVVLTLGTRF